jgi:hypothetical protein
VLTVVLVAVLLVAAWIQRALIVSVLSAILSGAVVPLVLGAVCEGLRITFHAYAYRRSFKVIGANIPLRSTVAAWFKAIFMNTVLPSGGTSGLAAVIDTARRRGVAVGSATSATIFTQTCFYMAMFLIILLGFWVMARAGSLQASTVAIGMIMGVVSAAFLGLLVMGHCAPGVLQRGLRAVERLVAGVCARIPRLRAPKPWADALVHSFSAAATELSRRPKQALSVFASMIVAMTFDALAFAACGFAFNVEQPDALFAGYVTALVFNSFNVTPGGVGVVEGLASAVLAGYGYPLSLCMSVVLVYRAFMYWVPFLVGAVVVRVSAASGAGGASGAADAEKRQGEPVYVRRRRSDVPLRERAATYVASHVDACSLALGTLLTLLAVAGFVAAGLPADPVVADAVAGTGWTGPLTPTAMSVCAYLLLLVVPGVLTRDQGNWLLAMAFTLCLGVSTALAGRSVWVLALAVAALVLLAVWHGTFGRRGYFRNLPRMACLLVYAVAVAVLYALAGAAAFGFDLTPDPGLGGVLWMGLQALVGFPVLPGVEVGPRAAWLYGSVHAVAVASTATVLLAGAAVLAQRVTDRRRAAAEDDAAEKK